MVSIGEGRKQYCHVKAYIFMYSWESYQSKDACCINLLLPSNIDIHIVPCILIVIYQREHIFILGLAYFIKYNLLQ